MQKLRQFQKYLKKQKIDFAIILASDPNMLYFNKFNESGLLIIPAGKLPFLLMPEMEYENSKKQSRIKKIYKAGTKKFSKLISKTLKTKNFKKIGINKKLVSVLRLKKFKKLFKKAKFSDVGGYLDDLRQTKTEREIAKIRKACRITDSIMHKFIKNFRKFKTEQQATIFIINEILSSGCELSFDPIVASGKNASFPHYNALKHKKNTIKKGFCVVDFGVKYNNYCSDITRTIYFGKPTKKQIKEYNSVLNAQKNTIKSINKNTMFKDLFDQAREALGKRFIHSLGHGIGVEIHEKPMITGKNKSRIKENEVFAIEPAIYKKNEFGIRIEDAVLVKSTRKNNIKAEILTKTKKDLIIIN